MPRPKNTIPSTTKNLCLPTPLVNKVDLILFSPLEGRVPFGAWKEFVTQAIEEKLARTVAKKAANNMFIGQED